MLNSTFTSGQKFNKSLYSAIKYIAKNNHIPSNKIRNILH